MKTEHILVLEDAPLVRNQLRMRLEAEGYRVSVASQISEALHSVQTHMPDLVVLDLTLAEDGASSGVADGFAFLRLLRGTYAETDAAVVIFSASDTLEVEARAKAMGVFATVQKKEGLSALLTAIRTALDERKYKHAEAATADDPDFGRSF